MRRSDHVAEALPNCFTEDDTQQILKPTYVSITSAQAEETHHSTFSCANTFDALDACSKFDHV